MWFHYSSAPQQFLQCHKAHANMGLDELGGGGGLGGRHRVTGMDQVARPNGRGVVFFCGRACEARLSFDGQGRVGRA